MAADTNSPVPLLRVTDLTVRYGGVLALDSVSLDVPAAGFVGLIGPNGAGKTTFVDALTGFARYTGEVCFNGARLDRQPAYLRARHGLARTFQSGGVFDDLTVEENILIGERSGSGWLPALTSVLTGRSAPASRATREIVGSLGLTGLLGLRAEELSEGQRKLVSVAQALASKAKLLLLDEPAAGLDLGGREDLLQRIAALLRDPRSPMMVLVTHHVEEVPEGFTHGMLLRKGSVLAAGPLPEVFTERNLSRCFGVPLQVERRAARWSARAARTH